MEGSNSSAGQGRQGSVTSLTDLASAPSGGQPPAAAGAASSSSGGGGGGGGAANAGAAATATLTITEEATQDVPEEQILRLSLAPRPSVTWDEGTVNNEGLGRKSSKRCCIFHKQRPFGESSTDSSDYDSDESGSSSSSGGEFNGGGGGKKAAAGGGGGKKKKHGKKKKGKKIARPKSSGEGDKKVPDHQRYHA